MYSRGSRGQSEVLGIVLLFAIVLTVVGVVVMTGGQAIQQTTDDTSMQEASESMLQLQSAATSGSNESVSFVRSGDGGNVQAAGGREQVESSDGVDVDPDAGSIEVYAEYADGSSDEIATVDKLGRVTYETDGQNVTFQGGAVFSRTHGASSSALVSPPPFEYRVESGAPTLSMRLVKVTASADGVQDGTFTLRQVSAEDNVTTSDFSNPLADEDSSVVVEITSRYHDGWETYFEEQGASVSTTDSTPGDGIKTVKIEFEGPPEPGEEIESGALLYGQSELTNDITIDSYDSGVGDYSSTQDSNGDVKVRGDIDGTASPEIKGDLVATGSGHFTNSIDVHGRTILGESGERTEVENDGRYRSTFSTEGDLRVAEGGGSPEFNDDVVVGGEVDRFTGATVDGSVSVHGDFDAGSDFRDTTIGDDLVVGGSMENELGGDMSGSEVDGHLSVQETALVDGALTDMDKVSAGDRVIVSGGSYSGLTIKSKGDVVINGSTTLNGPTIDANGDVIINESATVNGGQITADDITGRSVPADTETSTDTVTTDLPYEDIESPTTPDVTDYESKKDEIEEKHETLYDDGNNDNSELPGTISDIESGDCASTCTLTSGSDRRRYAVDGIDLEEGDTLRFEGGGTVILYVHNSFTLTSATIDVDDGTDVRVYMFGNGPNAKFKMDRDQPSDPGSSVAITGDDATNFQVFLMPDMQASIVQDSTFLGLLYGPEDDDTGTATEIKITNTADVYGAVVGKQEDATSAISAIHYDEQFAEEEIGSGGDPTDGGQVKYVRVETSTVQAGNED